MTALGAVVLLRSPEERAKSRGNGVMAHGPIGSRDAPVFPAPDRLDLSCDATNHITFGFGPHQCIRSTSARTQLQVVYGTLYRPVPTLRPAIPFDQVPFRHNMIIYVVHGLPMTW